jgi:hypothetical protein
MNSTQSTADTRKTNVDPGRPLGSPSSGAQRARITRITETGEVLVSLVRDPRLSFPCHVLLTGTAVVLQPADVVLVLCPADGEERGIVLGLIGPYVPPTGEQRTKPTCFEVAAAESISLSCGASAIELRRDGKVLIRGKDIVSRADRVQRIKGGSVSIN